MSFYHFLLPDVYFYYYYYYYSFLFSIFFFTCKVNETLAWQVQKTTLRIPPKELHPERRWMLFPLVLCWEHICEYKYCLMYLCFYEDLHERLCTACVAFSNTQCLIKTKGTTSYMMFLFIVLPQLQATNTNKLALIEKKLNKITLTLYVIVWCVWPVCV